MGRTHFESLKMSWQAWGRRAWWRRACLARTSPGVSAQHRHERFPKRLTPTRREQGLGTQEGNTQCPLLSCQRLKGVQGQRREGASLVPSLPARAPLASHARARPARLPLGFQVGSGWEATGLATPSLVFVSSQSHCPALKAPSRAGRRWPDTRAPPFCGRGKLWVVPCLSF